MPTRVPAHRPARLAAPSRHRQYDRGARDAESKRFYDSARWRKTRALKLQRDPQCEDCWARGILVEASHVHHVVELRDDPDRALDQGNLRSLCHPCHSRLHASAGGAGATRAAAGG